MANRCYDEGSLTRQRLVASSCRAVSDVTNQSWHTWLIALDCGPYTIAIVIECRFYFAKAFTEVRFHESLMESKWKRDENGIRRHQKSQQCSESLREHKKKERHLNIMERLCTRNKCEYDEVILNSITTNKAFSRLVVYVARVEISRANREKEEWQQIQKS